MKRTGKKYKSVKDYVYANYCGDIRLVVDATCCLACRLVIKGPQDIHSLGHGIMYLCALCGNKRCPRLQWHGYKCTKSNEPDQVPERIG